MHHEHDEKVTYMATECMERMFLNSPEGKRYHQEYMQLHDAMKVAQDNYHQFWQRVNPEFMHYMENM